MAHSSATGGALASPRADEAPFDILRIPVDLRDESENRPSAGPRCAIGRGPARGDNETPPAAGRHFSLIPVETEPRQSLYFSWRVRLADEEVYDFTKDKRLPDQSLTRLGTSLLDHLTVIPRRCLAAPGSANRQRGIIRSGNAHPVRDASASVFLEITDRTLTVNGGGIDHPITPPTRSKVAACRRAGASSVFVFRAAGLKPARTFDGDGPRGSAAGHNRGIRRTQY